MCPECYCEVDKPKYELFTKTNKRKNFFIKLNYYNIPLEKKEKFLSLTFLAGRKLMHSKTDLEKVEKSKRKKNYMEGTKIGI